MFPAFALANGIDARNANSMMTYIFTKPVLQNAAKPGEVIDGFIYSDWGVDFYSNGIVAIEDYINQKPEVVRSFVQATMQGVEYAIAHASESVSILKKHQPQLNEELAIKEIPILQDLIITKAPGQRLGSMNREKMRETVDQTIKYLDLKVLVGGRSGLYQRVLEIAPASRIKWEFSALRRSMPFGATDD